MSGPRAVPAEPEPAGGISPLSLLPPLFLAGLMLYEFAPGFVTGSIQAASDSETLMSTYAATALLLAASLGATTLLMHFEAGKRYVTRFVVPFIAVGLLLVALLGPGEQTIAFACIITGTSVFDAFVYSSFAQRVQRTGVSGLRLFAWGQFVIQVAILVAFVLGLALAGRDSTWITTVSLVLVSLIILGGRFDLHGAEKDPTSPATGAPGAAHANPGQVAVGPEDDEAHPVFDCAAFAKRHGYSVREEEILNLVSCGFNAPPSPTGSASRPAPSRRTSSTCTARQASPIAKSFCESSKNPAALLVRPPTASTTLLRDAPRAAPSNQSDSGALPRPPPILSPTCALASDEEKRVASSESADATRYGFDKNPSFARMPVFPFPP